MTAKKNVVKKSEPLDAKVADKLLDLLSTDNAFRRLFKKDPLGALVQAGYKPPKQVKQAPLGSGATLVSTETVRDELASPADCMRVERIASKAEIARSREELFSALTSGLSLIPQRIDASYNSASTRRRR